MLTQRNEYFFMALSYAMVMVIFINLNTIQSPIIGIVASTVYFLINGAFLGRLFSEKNSFLNLMFGNLLLVTLLGLISWMVMIAYNLDMIRSAIALFILTIVCSVVALKTKSSKLHPEHFASFERKSLTYTSLLELLYMLSAFFTFYLLFLSRSQEVYTVWQALNPLFLPVFFLTTFLLLSIIFSRALVEHKLIFTTIHSILSHSLFVIIFPVGDIGGQQLYLSETRLVFDNVIFHGWGWPQKNILLQVYYWTRGNSFQTSLSVIFARMFRIDVYWTHILLVPVLWGIFAPFSIFMIARLLSGDENLSVFSSLLLSLFPLTIYWGAISAPNSLGFIFFLFSLIFILKSLYSDGSRTIVISAGLSLVSFLTHFLTGVFSFALLFLAIALRSYEKEKKVTPLTAKLQLLPPLLFSAIILPSALIFQRYLYPFNTHFTLEKLSGLSLGEAFSSLVLGEYINLSVGYLGALLLGPLLGFFGMLCWLFSGAKVKAEERSHACTLFLFLGFLLFLIDYRILKFFLTNVPFQEERIWVFRDFFAVPFVAVVIVSVVGFLNKKAVKTQGRVYSWFSNSSLANKKTKLAVLYSMMFVILSGWITASLYYGYPHFAPLQTTSYEVEAVKYIDTHAGGKYIVICDQWMIFAGGMFVGVNNPRAFYFASWDPRGVSLFVAMKNNPSNDTLIDTMKYNNATVAYFIIEKPRLGADTYNDIFQQAQQNGLQTYQIFYYQGEEKLHIFYFKRD